MYSRGRKSVTRVSSELIILGKYSSSLSTRKLRNRVGSAAIFPNVEALTPRSLLKHAHSSVSTDHFAFERASKGKLWRRSWGFVSIVPSCSYSFSTRKMSSGQTGNHDRIAVFSKRYSRAADVLCVRTTATCLPHKRWPVVPLRDRPKFGIPASS